MAGHRCLGRTNRQHSIKMKSASGILMLPFASLRDRGWTRKTVEALLGEPDLIIETPGGDKTIRKRFYKLERIEAAERTGAFKEKRRATAKEREEAWRKHVHDRLLSRLSEFNVTINREDIELVRRNAQHFYGTRKSASAEENAVEYLKIAGCVNYDRTLAGDALGYNRSEIVTAARTKVLEAIADAYPEFAAECKRQIANQKPAVSFQQ
jgi:hypothetical protein